MKKYSLGNKNLIKKINCSLILNAIKEYAPIGRADIARILGLSPATVTSLTADLIRQGLICEKEIGNSSGGRPPILLMINPRGGFAIGVKLTEKNITAVLSDLEGAILASDTLVWDGKTQKSVVSTIQNAVSDLCAMFDVPKKKLLGIGVGLAGIVDVKAGILKYSPFLPWKDLDIQAKLRQAVKVPVFVDNDVNTLTLSEMLLGSGQAVDNFLVITIGRGVGAGIVVNGQIYRGWHGGAGELGHIIVEENGALCHCGKRGCLEAYVSDSALEKRAAEEMGIDQIAINDLVVRADAGDPAAISALSNAGEILGIAISNLINLFDPELVIFGGEEAQRCEILLKRIQVSIQKNAFPGFNVRPRIVQESWGDEAWARGAACLALRELFESPFR